MTIRDELIHKTICPFAENENRKTSPWGKAVEELIELEINLTSVWRGRKPTSNAF
jgi:hypothetical protein